jgi:hypothetical protein
MTNLIPYFIQVAKYRSFTQVGKPLLYEIPEIFEFDLLAAEYTFNYFMPLQLGICRLVPVGFLQSLIQSFQVLYLWRKVPEGNINIIIFCL